MVDKYTMEPHGCDISTCDWQWLHYGKVKIGLFHNVQEAGEFIFEYPDKPSRTVTVEKWRAGKNDKRT